MRAFSWALDSGRFLFRTMIDEERFAFGNPVGSSRHIDCLGVLRLDVPVAMADCASDADVGQAQDFVFLRTVIRLAVAGLAQSGHAIHLILVWRTGQVLAIAQQEHRVGLQTFGTVIGQLFQATGLIRQARIHINYMLNMLFYQ